MASIGDDSAPASAERYLSGLAALEREDEPTLIVAPGLIDLAAPDYHAVCQQILALCKKLGDRFAILDVQGGDVAAFRDNIGTADLAYAAAYHPYLITSLTHRYDEQQVTSASGDQQTTSPRSPPPTPAATTGSRSSSKGSG